MKEDTIEAMDAVEVEVVTEDKTMDAKGNKRPLNVAATRTVLFTQEQNTSGANALWTRNVQTSKEIICKTNNKAVAFNKEEDPEAVDAVEATITSSNISIITNNNIHHRIRMILMRTIQLRLVISAVTIHYHHRLNQAIKAIIITINNHSSQEEDLVGEMNVTTIAILVTGMAQPTTITITQIIIPLRRQGTY